MGIKLKQLISNLNDIINDKTYKIILSNPNKQDKLNKHIKFIINKINDKYQVEKYTETQVFHENIIDIISFINSDESSAFKQINIWDESYELILKRNDGNLFLISKKSAKNAPVKAGSHNREKNYIIPKNTVIPPLVDIGVLTSTGDVVPSMYDKYKQINRFLEMLNDTLGTLPKHKKINIIDFGCGKSYLTFVTYYYFTHILELDAHIVGLDLKEDVINNCNLVAKKYDYNNLHFEVGDIAEYSPSEAVDVVISLHACDTATDYALYNAVKWGTKYIFSVPCCQHEVNEQIKSESFALLTKYGIVKERISAVMTDAVRGNMLCYNGYTTQLLEFVDLSHTSKNIMIRAVKSNLSLKTRQDALQEVQKLMEEFNITPTLYKLFIND